MDLLKQLKNNIFSSQTRDNTQLSPLFIDNEPQYTIEEIKRARLRKMGKENRRKVLIKWKKYKKEI
jgi:hypothetical protein